MASISGFFGIFPQRGFVQPSDSGLSSYDQGHEPIYLVLDCMVSETPEYSFSPTKSQIETGATISDHVVQNPLRLNVEGIVSDSPLDPRQFASAFSGLAPSDKAFKWLEQLAINKEPFDFVGGFRTYKSMVITEFKPVRNAQTGQALVFTCVMEQLVIVGTQVLAQQPKTKIQQSKVSHGGQPLQPLPTSQLSAVQSVFQGVEPTAQVTAAPTVAGALF